MNKMIYKGRERIVRDRLRNFTDLPVEKQDIFKKIKQTINEYISTEVYVFGSYNHGYWDEESDYDVIIPSTDYVDILDITREKVGVKVDLMFSKYNMEYIAIP
jgi:predicted nucleotidyltransferase